MVRAKGVPVRQVVTPPAARRDRASVWALIGVFAQGRLLAPPNRT
jgi:hypothetical protein